MPETLLLVTEATIAQHTLFPSVQAEVIYACLSPHCHHDHSDSSVLIFLPLYVTEFPAATEDSPQMKRVQPPPVPQLRHIPPPPVRIDKTARRNSFSATCQYPAYAKLFSAAELQLATDNFTEENLLGEGPLGSVYRAKLPDGQVYLLFSIFEHSKWEIFITRFSFIGVFFENSLPL